MEDVIKQLKELGELLKSGAISQEEFQVLKKELLKSNKVDELQLNNQNTISQDSVDKTIDENNKEKIKLETSTFVNRFKIPKRKTIIISSIGLLLIFFVYWSSRDNEFTREIKNTCSDCEEIEIAESDFILTTNSEGRSNIFSKTEMTFILSEWYVAKFNEGFFFDDITFTIDDKEISVSESDYHLINDYYLLSKSQPVEYDKWKKIADMNHEFLCECYESAKNEGGDVYEAIKKCDEKYFPGFSLRDNLSESDNQKAIRYSDQLYAKRQKEIKKYLPKASEKIYTCSICGKSIGRDGSSLWGGKCYQCYQYSNSSRSNVDLTRF